MTEGIIEDWKERIKNSWESSLTKMIADKDVLCNWVPFYETIWEMSQKAFDIPREVQVVIDANDNLFISVGAPGFVSFEGDEGQLSGMKMPIFSWIHTHPFGDAYFSSRDLLTISMWERFMQHATSQILKLPLGRIFVTQIRGANWQKQLTEGMLKLYGA